MNSFENAPSPRLQLSHNVTEMQVNATEPLLGGERSRLFEDFGRTESGWVVACGSGIDLKRSQAA